MKTISQHLTAGALAVAGTVATFGLGSVAQAATVNGAFDASSAPGSSNALTFSPTGNLGTATSLTLGVGAVFDIGNTPDPFLGLPNDFANAFPLTSTTGSWTGGNLLSQTGTLFTFGPGGRFSFSVTTALAKVGGGSTFVVLEQYGTFADSLSTYTPTAALVTFTAQTSNPSTGESSYSFSFSSPPVTPPPATPEPGTVLGILAVAGAGAIARRKR